MMRRCDWRDTSRTLAEDRPSRTTTIIIFNPITAINLGDYNLLLKGPWDARGRHPCANDLGRAGCDRRGVANTRPRKRYGRQILDADWPRPVMSRDQGRSLLPAMQTDACGARALLVEYSDGFARMALTFQRALVSDDEDGA